MVERRHPSMQISTITTRHDLTEDRIHLAVADLDGNRASLWLTRRITVRLIPLLVEGVQKQLTPPLDQQPNIKQEAIEAANVYAQLQARMTRKHVPPVDIEQEAGQSLIHEIAVQTTPSGVRTLEFRGVDQRSATLTLSLTEQRQWLESLKLACDKAQWALDVWPAWMGAPVSSQQV